MEYHIENILFFKDFLDKIVEELKTGDFNEKLIIKISKAITEFKENQDTDTDSESDSESILKTDSITESESSDLSISLSVINMNHDKLLNDFINDNLKLDNYYYSKYINPTITNQFYKSCFHY